jgi:hypothetical protein
MARKQNTNAARERKQKIIVGVGLVVFAGLMVLQGPKLLDAFGGGGSEQTAAPAATATPQATPASDGATTTNAPAPQTFAVRAPKNARAHLAGVVIVPEQPVKPGDGQLGSFSRFDGKDPFVQQVSEEPLLTPAQVGGFSKAKANATAAKLAGSTAAAAAASAGAAPVANLPSASAPAVQPTIALLSINGKIHTVELDKRFPQSDRAFVLHALKPGRATIAVADGDFVGGGTLVLRVGRTATLVNTATGARYVVKLLFVGDESQVTRFTPK